MEYLSSYVDEDDEDADEHVNQNHNEINTISKKRIFKDEPEQNQILKKAKQDFKNEDSYIASQQNILVGIDDDEIPDPPSFLFESLSDSNNNNNGRHRHFEHVEGNFPTFVFIKIPKNRNDITKLINEIKMIGKCVSIEEDVDDYHISLSRTFPIREHHIDSIEKELKMLFRNQHKFYINLDSATVFTNDNRSRLFISSLVQLNKQLVVNLIRLVDKCLELFKFPVFYDEPEPHLSICWSLPNDGNRKYQNLDSIKESLEFKSDPFIVDKIYWSIGKFEYNVDLL
eukprot:gene1160-1470_t